MKTYTQFWDQLQHAYPVSKGKFRLPIATKFLELDAEKLANFEANLITLTQSLLDSAVTQPNYRETISKNEPQILPLLQGNFTGILRYDVLLDQNGDFKVIEINADYPDGLVLHDYTYSTLFGADDHKNTQLYLQLFDPEQTIFVLYPKDARFVDAYYQEYETLKKNWFPCFIGTEDDLRFEEGKIFFQDQEIHVIKRCCEVGRMSHTFFSHLQSAKKHIYINSFDLRGLGYKEFLQQIHHPYIPETHLLTRDIADRVIANKEQRIIKPTNLFEGQGVYLGGEYSDQEWERLVQENIDQQFVAQEYVQISKIPQYFYDEGEIIEKEVFFDICPHLFIKNGKVLGIWQILARYSEHKILNVAKGGGIGYVKERFLSKLSRNIFFLLAHQENADSPS